MYFGVDKMLASPSSRERNLAIDMIVVRVISPGSKLVTARRAKVELERQSTVAPEPCSKAAARKDQSKRTDDEPVHCFRTRLDDLGTLAKNSVRFCGSSEEFYVLAKPTAIQTQALKLLGIAQEKQLESAQL